MGEIYETVFERDRERMTEDVRQWEERRKDRRLYAQVRHLDRIAEALRSASEPAARGNVRMDVGKGPFPAYSR